jgi:hypothetical protein
MGQLAEGCVQSVEGKPHVDSLLLARQKRMRAEARNLDGLVAVDKRTAIDGHASNVTARFRLRTGGSFHSR